MTGRRATILALAVFAAPAGAGTVFEPILEEEFSRRGLPALSVAILRRGEVVFARGYGLADREQGQAADERTVFPIGSISKQFTAAAIMLLVERGTLSLDQSIASLLPGSPESWEPVTVEHLLRQTSGLREFFTIPAVRDSLSDLSRPSRELLAHIRGEPLGFAPGERWAYSNSSYTLLAAIIEQVTGARYERFLEQEFFREIGLDIWHCTSWPDGPNEAHGYAHIDGAIRPAAPENMNWARGGGGLCANAIDLARWGHALASGRIVSKPSFAMMTSRRATADGLSPDYGFGLSLIDLEDHARVAHTGAIGGFAAALAHYPEEDLTIALLGNLEGAPLEAIEKRLARAALGIDAPRYTPQPLTAAERRRLAGTYDIGVFEVGVLERAGRLRMEMPWPGHTGDLVHLGNGTLVSEEEPDAYRIRFEPAASSSTRSPPAERMVLLMSDLHWYGRRVQPRPE
jgi:CubicO group peptidase (beta-lactamase class C family)